MVVAGIVARRAHHSGLAEPGEDAYQQVLYRIFTTLVPFLQNILLLVMVPLLIHEEPLVGYDCLLVYSSD